MTLCLLRRRYRRRLFLLLLQTCTPRVRTHPGAGQGEGDDEEAGEEPRQNQGKRGLEARRDDFNVVKYKFAVATRPS